jgi:hypothetical protein
MTLLARRERDRVERRERVLVGMRAAVVAEMPHLPTLGSSPIDEAVDVALDELRAQGQHLASDPEDLQQLWALYARRRLIDRGRSAESRRRDRIPVEQHTEALAQAGIWDLGELTEDDRDWWRALEILSVLPGDQAVWGKAWFREIAAGRSGRGLAGVLGWSPGKTEKVSQRARAQMIKFLQRRASGSVCSDRRTLLDAFNATRTNRAGGLDWSEGDGLDQRRFEVVLAHLMSCDDCSTAWETGRRAPLSRCAAVLIFPFGHAVAAAAALRAKLAALLAGAHGAAFSLRQRLGVGGSAALTGGGAATLGGKTAAICGAVLCTAGAAGGLVDAVPSILPQSGHHAHHSARPVAHHQARASAATYTPPPTTAPVTTSTTPVSPAGASTGPAASTATTKPDPSYTPGNLPPAASQASTGGTSAASPTNGSSGVVGGLPSQGSSTTSSSAPTTQASSQPSCTPGDLGC